MSDKKEKIKYGIIMPISKMGDYTSEHWSEVKSILEEALEENDEYEFKTKLVCDADDIGLIHKRIVQNVYDSDIVICDVSGKNPNVMFELGMRLAFDKPIVIVKDETTDYTFDAGIIEHIAYPRGLRFKKIVEFKKELSNRVVSTVKKYMNEKCSPYLENFGTFKVAKLKEEEITESDAILKGIDEIKTSIAHNTANIRRLQRNNR